ncbi:Urease accessory protein UreF [Roseobacter fucihabitans]|uniref:Urease accessory protein UreF n=2 Tax=Roseobacter fucihabitans TaxID=1537242 RepID=A0ABZ2BR45_9RHOB|nr:Urease accessory protein UreF [Roseobacter litoralis]
MGMITARNTDPIQRIRMSTDAVMTLTQWLSPGFPVGAFAYSHGLETVIETGEIRSIQDLEIWLVDLIKHGSGRTDIVLLSASYSLDLNVTHEADTVSRAFAASAERLLETDQQGGAFCRTLDAVWNTKLGALTYPVAVGHAACIHHIPLALTARMYLHAFAANLISAAVRLIPLGQTEGQALLARLVPLIQSTAQEAVDTPLSDLASHCFAGDIAAMQHETQYSKVFRT